jgi:hypothetical protein
MFMRRQMSTTVLRIFSMGVSMKHLSWVLVRGGAVQQSLQIDGTSLAAARVPRMSMNSRLRVI